MLLAIDIGNTNVKFGLYDGDEPKGFWRLSTKASRTSDEYGSMLHDLLRQKGLSFADIDAAVMSSVVPALNYTIEHMCKDCIGATPLAVTHTLDTGLKIAYDRPEELGTDRLVGAAAAYHMYGGPVLVIDFGSATTFNAVNADGVFLGGAIAPGIKTSAESLSGAAAKLPLIELASPESALGADTKSCMQSGIIFGFAGLVKYLAQKLTQTEGMKGAKIIATGGLSQLITDVEPELFDVVDRELALNGLKYIFARNLGVYGKIQDIR